MKVPRQVIGFWSFIFVVAAFAGAAFAKETTSICQSPKGSFSTQCPTGWNKLDMFDDSISIISFPLSQREEGVVIKDGGAQIILSKHKMDGASLSQWIKKDNMGTRALTRTLKGKAFRNAACSNTAYLEVEVDQGGPPSEIDSQIYCSIAEYVFKFQLRYWANDRKIPAYKSALATVFDNFRAH
jgi:uncharacterized protein YodC (DUF2158 family)